MASQDQLLRLGYDRIGYLGDLQFVYAPRRWLDVQAGVLVGLFPASRGYPPGGVITGLLGLLLHAPFKRVSPLAFFDIGPAFTGDVVRPMFRVGAGIDVTIRRGVAMGPLLGFGEVMERDDPGLSEDAKYMWAGLSIRYRSEPPPPPRPRHITMVQQVHRHHASTVVQHVHQAPAPPPVVVEHTDDPELMLLLDDALPAPQERVELLAPVLFAFDSDALEPLGVAMLHEVERVLEEHTEFALIAIEGYSDRRGTESYNRDLAQRRAERVRDWLVQHGIAAERLLVRANGTESLVEPDEHEAAHAQNRRVVFRVLERMKP